MKMPIKIKIYLALTLAGIILAISLLAYINRSIEKSKQNFNNVNDIIFTDIEDYLNLCIETKNHKCRSEHQK